MTYATYDYYATRYLGSTLTEEQFFAYARRASAEIDHVTFGRLNSLSEAEVPDAVRDAVCAVADRLRYFDASEPDQSGLASEVNDGYHVTYKDSATQMTKKQEIQSIIRTYLAGTGLMYRGVVPQYDLCRP